MNDEDIKKILQKMEIPEPDESKKEATIKATMSEFHKQKTRNPEIIPKELKTNDV